MPDPLLPRIYRPYRRTREAAEACAVVVSLVGGIFILLAVCYPEPLREAPRGLPPPIVIAVSAVTIAWVDWAAAMVLLGRPSVEITGDAIVSRFPLRRPTRIPLSAIIGFIWEGPRWAPVPYLLWRKGAKTAKFGVPLFRADDGTLLRAIAPALAGPAAGSPSVRSRTPPEADPHRRQGGRDPGTIVEAIRGARNPSEKPGASSESIWSSDFS